MDKLKLDIQRFADGEVIIETKLDTTGIDKGMSELQKKLQKLKEKSTVEYNEITGVAVTSDNLTKEEQAYYDRLQASLDKLQLKKTKMLMADEQITDNLREQAIVQEQASDNVNKWVDGVMTLSNGTRVVKDETGDANSEFQKMNVNLSGIGNSIEKITKKVKKWALAIFGVRSAYMFIRQAMSTLSQSDEQLATNIEYIKWALATMIKPIIEWIVKAVYTVLSLIGSLVKAIFGVNIFANATADAFKKQKESMNGTNKEAKQLQKTLAGFDEMNVLQENGTTTPGGGGGGFTPEIDLGNLKNPSFIKGLKNFWKEIFDFWEKDWKDVFNNLDGKWGAFIGGIILTVKGFWDILKGIGELIIGLVQMIVGLVTGDFELVKQGFNIMIEGIKNILIGALEIITGLLLTVFGFVKGIFLTIWDFIYDYFIEPVTNAFSGLIETVKKPFTAIVDTVKGLWDKIKEPIEKLVKKINKALDKINPINLWDDIKSGAKSGWNKVKSFFGFAKGGIVYNNLPKLASGGVINQPGRGVPIASAVGGERGAEGVIPLTDSQQMALLGEAIGRYITVNLTNVTELDGRTIARKVAEVNSNTDFLLNR